MELALEVEVVVERVVVVETMIVMLVTSAENDVSQVGGEEG